jgi:hypothetical protein
MRFNDAHVKAVHDLAAIEDNFPQMEDSSQTASILLPVSDS